MMKVTLFSWFAVFGLCLGLSPLVATADDAADGPQPAELFETLDKNSDGQIDADEVGEERAKFFARLVRVGDEDKDGKLSKDEFVNATKPEPEPTATAGDGGKGKGKNKNKRGGQDPKKLFGRLDKNGDGTVTKDEIPEKQKKRFDRIFTRLDKDELTLEDFEKFSGKGKAGKKKAKGEGKKPDADGKKTAKKGPGPGPGAGRPEGRPDPDRMFKRFDGDEDGKLTVDEVPEGFKERFAAMLKRAGKDEDGSINLNEFRRVARPGRGEGDGPGPRRGAGRGRFGGPPRPPAFFAKLDANDDKKLSKEEMTKIFELFDELDKNEDGLLDGPELLGAPGRRGPGGDRPAFGRRGERPERGRRPESGEAGRRGRGRMLLERLDEDKDGKISKEEADERLKRHFERMDKNSDGFLEGQELRFFGRPDGGPGGKGGKKGKGKNKDQSPDKSEEKPADSADGKDA